MVWDLIVHACDTLDPRVVSRGQGLGWGECGLTVWWGAARARIPGLVVVFVPGLQLRLGPVGAEVAEADWVLRPALGVLGSCLFAEVMAVLPGGLVAAGSVRSVGFR